MASGYSARLAAMIDRCIQHLGDGASASLRRPSQLVDFDSNRPATAAVVNGVHAPGATTLSLRLAFGALAGQSLAGQTFSITGHVTPYTAAGDAQAANGVLNVPLAAGLAAGAADGIAVAISDFATFTYPHVQYVRVADRDVDGYKIGSHDLMVAIPAIGAPTVPDKGDLITDDNGDWSVVHTVWPMKPGGVNCGWRVLIGKPAVGAFR